MNGKRKVAEIGKECVACGCCAAVCPREAITMYAGITARVETGRCVGCGKCAAVCPAAVILITERRDSK